MRARPDLQRRLPSIAATSIAFLLLVCLVGGSRTYAQSAEAEVLFNDGIKLLGEGKVVQACAAFYASNRIEPRAGTLIHLGECRERNQQLASAWSAYKDALIRVKDPRKREIATAKAAALEPRLSYLTVWVSDESRVGELTLTRNGQLFDPVLWNQALPVDGGDYTIAGRAPGHEEWRTTVHVATEGAKVSVKVPRFKELSKPAPPRSSLSTSSGNHEAPITIQAHEVTEKTPGDETQPKHAPPALGALEVSQSPYTLTEARPWAAWKPWAVVGAGASVVAVSGVFHFLAAHNFNTFDSAFSQLPCATMGGCVEADIPSNLSSRLSQARLEQKIAVGSFIAGTASITAGVVLLYLNRPHRLAHEDATPNTPGAALIPVVSHDMVGLVVAVSH